MSCLKGKKEAKAKPGNFRCKDCGAVSKKKKPADIAAGIQLAVVKRVMAMARRVGIRPTFAISGGCAKNEGLLILLEERLKMPVARLKYDPQQVGALGAAIMARRRSKIRT